jgi:hypothetical protein
MRFDRDGFSIIGFSVAGAEAPDPAEALREV